MTRAPLSQLEDWQLEYEDQDVRGWPVQDQEGNRLGMVEEMIVNTDEGYVDAIVLDNGVQYPTGDILLRDGVVFLRTSGTAEEDEVRVQRSEEELRAGTREREVGAIRVRKQVRTDREQIEVPTRREEVKVDRVPLKGDKGEASEAEIGEDEVRVPITEEEVVVEKRPVAKEEVRIRKDTVEDTEVVEEDLRREEVDIEKDDA